MVEAEADMCVHVISAAYEKMFPSFFTHLLIGLRMLDSLLFEIKRPFHSLDLMHVIRYCPSASRNASNLLVLRGSR
jgi:hypothetical protein